MLTTRLDYRLKTGILIFCVFILEHFRFAFDRIVGLNPFVDEWLDISSAFNFFKSLNYTPFPPAPFSFLVSSGLVSTFPGGLGWIVGHTIFVSRLFTTAYTWLFGTFVIYFAFRKLNLSVFWTLILTSLTWYLFKRVPWSYGYIYNLGELQGALWVLLGVTLFDSKPGLASLCYGISVWHCKFIYLPITLGLLVVAWWTQKKRKISSPAKYALIFILPQLLWMLLIALRFDFATLQQCMAEFRDFVIRGNPGPHPLPKTLNLFERLNDPSGAWLKADDKKTVLFLLFFPLLVAATQTVRKLRQNSRFIFDLAISGLLGFFAAWYFFVHPTMWIRHLEPAFLLGFGYVIYTFCTNPSVLRVLNKVENYLVKERSIARATFWILLIIVASKALSYGREGFRYAKAARGNSFSFLCRDSLDSPECQVAVHSEEKH